MGVETGVIVGAVLFSSLLSASGSIQAGNAADTAARFNAEQLEERADIERENAAIQESQQREADARVLSSIRANVAADGLEFSGSPLEVFAEAAKQSELDALIIRRGGELTGRDLESQARIEKFQGKQKKIASRTEAAGTLLSGFVAAGKLGATKKPQKDFPKGIEI